MKEIEFDAYGRRSVCVFHETYLWKYIRNLWGGDQSFLLDHSGSALRCDGYHGPDRIIYYWMSVYDRTAGDALFKVQGTGKTK